MKLSLRNLSLALVLGATAATFLACSSPAESVTGSNEEELRNLEEDEIVGSIVLGEMSEGLENPGQRGYRALSFKGKAGDVVDAWVRTPDGDAMAYLLRSDFKTIVTNDDADATTKDAHLKSKLTADGTYYIAFREHDFEPATFSVDLRASKTVRAGDAGADADAAVKPDAIVAAKWTLQPISRTDDLRGVWGSSSTDIYAVGVNGTILHSTGNGTWTPQASGSNDAFAAIWGSGPDDIYVGGSSSILHSTGNGVWTSQPAPFITGIWGSGRNDVYAVGSSRILHSTGDGVWSLQANGLNATVAGVWGSGPSDVSVTGNVALHSAGADWTPVQITPTTAFLGHVWGSAGNDVYATSNISIFHSAGGGAPWTEQAKSPARELQGIWGSAKDDIYAVGRDGVVVHSVGDGAWSLQASAVGVTLSGIWGSGRSDVYAVGERGAIIHRQ